MRYIIVEFASWKLKRVQKKHRHLDFEELHDAVKEAMMIRKVYMDPVGVLDTESGEVHRLLGMEEDQ